MVEVLQPSQDAIDLAWNAAQAASHAYTDYIDAREATNKLTEVQDMDIPGVAVTPDIEAVSQFRSNALDNHELLMDIAGVVIKRDFNPFALETEAEVEVNPVDMPEISKETMDVIKGLPEGYTSVVLTNYASTVALISSLAGRIRSYKIDVANFDSRTNSPELEATQAQVAQLETILEVIPVPDLNKLVEKVVELAPSYEEFEKKGWQPNVAFIPRGLTTEQWNALLTGHDLPDGSKTKGAYSTFEGNEVINDLYAIAEPGSWGVVVYSDTDGPVLRNVSKDGKNGSGAKKAIEELICLPDIALINGHPETAIAQASPTREAYNAMQLNRLFGGLSPLDRSTWTIGRQDVKVGDAVKSVFLSFYPDRSQVRSRWSDRDRSGDYGGVRPSAER